MKRLMEILLVLLLVAMFIGCEKAKQAQEEAERQERIKLGTIQPEDLGNGVYSFECEGARWENSLVKFKGEHPELVITAMSFSQRTSHARTYLVITEKRY